MFLILQFRLAFGGKEPQFLARYDSLRRTPNGGITIHEFAGPFDGGFGLMERLLEVS